jgi:ATP-binding cassette subfamily C (CFTR/MRP) protein 4
LLSGVIGANVGLVITQVISLIGMCNWGIRQTAELENLMTSVERVVEYSNLPKEPSLDTPPAILNKLKKDWPQQGAIRFENVSLKYSEGSESVLKNLNFSVAGGVSNSFF